MVVGFLAVLCPDMPATADNVVVSMRPIYIPLRDFLLCFHAMLPFFYLESMVQLARRALLRGRVRYGLVQKADPAVALGRFILETSTAFWLREVHEADSRHNGRRTATFSNEYFGPLEMPAIGGGETIVELVEMVVDLDSRKAIAATLDGEELSLEQAFVFAVFQNEWHGHAWWHALAMWGIDLQNPDPWIQRMGLISLFQNHMGGDGAGEILTSVVQREVLLTGDSMPFQRPMPPFNKVNALVPHSRFLAFLSVALERFSGLWHNPEHSGMFSNMNLDSHFVCTVLHSLDHWMLHQVNEEAGIRALWEQSNDPSASTGSIDWRITGQMASFAYGLSDDYPKLYDVYMRQSSNP